MSAFCAAIDWGTSSFRLWVLDCAGNMLDEHQSDEGLLTAAKSGFSSILERHMIALGLPASVPVIICGMAGSRQGWKEAPYLDTPVELDAVSASAVMIGGLDRDIRILPGVAQRDPGYPDVMRGEETQLLGAMSANTGKALVCMPGTHSKWVSMLDRHIQDFSTYMTGDLFSAILQNTVLKFAARDNQEIDPSSPAFLRAVERALDEPAQISNQLFAIRSAGLLGHDSAKNAGAMLSGALIGLEIAAVKERYGAFEDVTLIAGAELAGLYKAAFDLCGLNAVHFDGDRAARAGLFAASAQFWMDDRNRLKA